VNYSLSIKTLSDIHLKEFINCPHKFYYHYIQREEASKVEWKKVMQFIVNQVVKDFFMLPVKMRTPIKALEIIEKHLTSIKTNIFDSKIDYYLVVAKVTDYLMQDLTKNYGTLPPLFINEKFRQYFEELETHLSLTIEVAEWEQESFTVTKYLVDTNHEMITLYYYLTVVFCERSFGRLPSSIRIVSLLNGEEFVHCPSPTEMKKGLHYIEKLIDTLSAPLSSSTKPNGEVCLSCPFVEVCANDEIEFLFQKKH
jgi:CRISPR/Cas system-associated exonuclease Cas4 (RecB family)